MRHWIDLLENAQYAVLYHGTKPDLVPDILKVGLQTETDVSWKEFGPGIYLTDNPEVARNYGSVLLAIDVAALNDRRLVPDDHELSDYFDGDWGDGTEGNYGADEFRPEGIFEASWKDSLRICNQCKYLDPIPASALRVVN